MAVYVGHDECQVIYVAKNGQQLRVSSVWVGDRQVFPPANRQEVHVFTRDTQGYGRREASAYFTFAVPVPWWATSFDVVIVGAGEKGRDGTKSFTGGSDGAGGRSGAWVVKTGALNPSTEAFVYVGKGTSTAPTPTSIYFPGGGVQPAVTVLDEEGTRTANSGSTGGTPSPQSRTEYGSYHYGSPGGSRNNPGAHPGGGGGGGQGSNLLGNPQTGRDGGDGYVWLRFRSAPALNPGDDEFILRVGVTSGVAYAPLHEWAVGVGKTYGTITEITVPMEVIGPSLNSLFHSCSSLVSIPDMDTSQVTNMRSLFYGCSSLTSIPALDTSQVTDMQHMFYGCGALASVPDLDTSQVTNMYGMFNGCSSLTSIPALDTSQVTDTDFMFYGCSSLESVTLPGMGDGFTTGSSEYSRTLDMGATKLNAAAANALMQSLGTPAPGGTLQLPTTATGASTSIAEAKNWTVTFG
jgi:surface protein